MKISKVLRNTDTGYVFMCPGCKDVHQIWTHHPVRERNWSFNGDVDRPTFKPSIRVTYAADDGTPICCHAFITDGNIEFLSDCTHTLAGQTVPLSEIS